MTSIICCFDRSVMMLALKQYQGVWLYGDQVT